MQASVENMDRGSVTRVFIAYTADDLSAHADVVAAVLRKLRIIAVDHRDSGATGQPSVSWCMEEVMSSDLIIVLVAHRYGWVPSPDEGGDGENSITFLEVKRAIDAGKTVLPYLVDDEARWPTGAIEGLGNPSILPKISAFRSQLSKTVAGFFTDPNSLDGPVSRDVPKAIARLQPHVRPMQRLAPEASGNGDRQVVPWIYDRVNPPSIADRMEPRLPKRILCIDSLLADSAIGLRYLERMEYLLQVRYREEDFTLSSYFDLIAGSGLGAIIATELALGKKISEFRDFIQALMTSANRKSGPLTRLVSHRFDPAPLRSELEQRYGSLTLASSAFKVGLALIATDLGAGIPCHFTNHPGDSALDTHGRIRLDRLLMGCISTPTHFPSVKIERPPKSPIVLSSAEVSGAANPTIYLLLMITNPKFPFRWRLGERRLNLISVGGINNDDERTADSMLDGNILNQINVVLRTFIRGTNFMSRILLAGLSHSGFQGADMEGGESPGLSFQRYESELNPSFLEKLGLTRLCDRIEELRVRNSPAQWGNFDAIGREAGKSQITGNSFSPAFDVRITG